MSLALSCHPDCLTDAVSAVDVDVDHAASGHFTLRYTVQGILDQLVMPGPAAPQRADNLWLTTCFEAFFSAPGEPAYLELNLSPSSEWALYAFESYREAMHNFELARAPRIETSIKAGAFELMADLDLGRPWAADADNLEIALAAVIEEKNGRKSLWALRHPSGRPDFHNRDGFIHKPEAMDPR